MNKNSDLLQDCVESRLNFLKKGYYDRVIEKLKELIYLGLNDLKNIDIIDSGCGPGFYMNKLKEFLDS